MIFNRDISVIGDVSDWVNVVFL